MKVRIFLLILLFNIFIITGCSNDKNFSCVTTRNGATIHVDGVIKKNKVSTLIIETSKEYESDDLVMLVVNETRSMAQENATDGIHVDVEQNEHLVKVKMTMEISKLTKEARENAGVDLSNLERDAFIKAIEDEGYVCK